MASRRVGESNARLLFRFLLSGERAGDPVSQRLSQTVLIRPVRARAGDPGAVRGDTGLLDHWARGAATVSKAHAVFGRKTQKAIPANWRCQAGLRESQ